ncbi:MAG: CDP-archaeol synthase [Phycisphaerales bacterium]|nr:CDP-archaeol synthase [Phycisphaerales bacterium]
MAISSATVPAVLKYRLMFGPLMILGLIGVLWLDEWLDHAAAPRWVPEFIRADGTWPPGLPIFLVGLALAPLACWELKAIFRAAGISATKGTLTFGAIAGMSACYLMPRGSDAPTGAAIISAAAALVLAVSLVVHSRRRIPQGATAAAGAGLIAFVYLGLLFGVLLLLRREHSAWVLLGVLVITKSCDIGAYFTGKAVGRRKLIPWLSPGKTWEGLVGGVALAAGVGVLAVWLERQTGADGGQMALSPVEGAVLGALLAITGQAGDLTASLLKRDAGIKDSGTILPGFGGVLDVIDSILLVAPVAYWYLRVW